MSKLSLCLLVGGVICLSGCGTAGSYGSKAKGWMFGNDTEMTEAEVETQRRATRSQYALLPMPDLMSNENVIVYPLEGDLDQRRQTFPENTTAGGYTVFDSSVQVFAVDGPEQKPDYLPEYAVPLYESGEYTTLRRPSPSLTAYKMEPNMKPTDITKAPLAPVKRSPKRTPGRRSAPVLTAYE